MTINDVERRVPFFGSVERPWTPSGVGVRQLAPFSHRYQGSSVFCRPESVLTAVPQTDAQPQAVPAAATKGGIAGHRPRSPDPTS